MKFLPRKIFLAGLCFLALAVTANAATKGRIMTNGKITMYKNGQAVSSYNDQGPLDENSLIGCDGTCLVKMQGIVLNAVDQTLFALKEQNNSVNLYVEKGKIYFVISDVAHQFVFYTPDGYYLKTNGFIAPAAAGSSVKGFIRVTDEATVIGMETGTMIVMTNDGTQTIKPGQSLVLAMADVPDDGNPAGNEDDDDDDRKGLILFWGGMSNYQQIGTVALGIGAAAGVGYLTFGDGSESSTIAEYPGSPPGGPTPPASPNR